MIVYRNCNLAVRQRNQEPIRKEFRFARKNRLKESMGVNVLHRTLPPVADHRNRRRLRLKGTNRKQPVCRRELPNAFLEDIEQQAIATTDDHRRHVGAMVDVNVVSKSF
jgi:hypothetical protein